MARAIEVAVVEAVEGKTRAQQIARLKEWKKFWLGLGAEKVVVQEVAVGCPFCRIMIGDGMTARESDVEVLDVAQVLLRNIKS